MKIQRIQQQSYHSSSMTKQKRPEGSVNFEGLRFRKDGFASKNCNPSFLLKMGAMAGAAAVTAKELFFNKVLEVNTVNQIKQDAINFGESLAEHIYLNDEKIDQKEIENLVIAHLGKEKSKNVKVATDEKEFSEFARKHLNISEDFAKQIYADMGGAVIPGGTSGKLLFVLRLEDKNPDQAVNIVAHEFEHLLYKASGLMSKIASQQMKIKSQKQKVEQKIIDHSQSINQKVINMQTSLITQVLGVAGVDARETVDVEPTIQGVVEMSPMVDSEEELNTRLGNYVCRVLIRPNVEKFNCEELHIFENMLRDEARAYEVGGKAQRYYRTLKEGQDTKPVVYEMISVLFDRMADVINEYKRLFAVSYLKKSMGLKYTDYYEPPKSTNKNVVKSE